MKRVIVWVLILAATVRIPPSLGAQEVVPHSPRYRLVDVGTFGGPNSVYNVTTRIATDDGRVVGAANTADPDLNASPYCFDQETCFVQHAWEWRKGVVTDLGVLQDGYSSYTNAINVRGLIAGQSQKDGIDPVTGGPVVFLATVWDHGRIRSLGTFGGGNSIALGVNDQDFVIGAAENGIADTLGFPSFLDQASQIRPFGWSDGRIFDLGDLGGPGAFPLDVNNRGQVVGISLTSSVPTQFGAGPTAPFLWEKGRMRNLGSLGGLFGGAAAINDRGQVVGASDLAGDQESHAFLWEDGRMIDLGTLGGSVSGAAWMSENGYVTGYSLTEGNQGVHAFLWTHGKMKDLIPIDGEISTNAWGVNSRGQVVGQSWYWDGHEVTSSHAFVSVNGERPLDLNTLLTNSSDLNMFEADYVTDSGWIVARGFAPNGEVHTAILIPDDDGGSDASVNGPLAPPLRTATHSQSMKVLTPQMRAVLKARFTRGFGSESFLRPPVTPKRH
jgi:probable HAF family extracellular repeat protein